MHANLDNNVLGCEVCQDLKVVGRAAQPPKPGEEISVNPRKLLPALVIIAALLFVPTAPAGADDGGRPLSTTLTGAAERPGPGDPDGTGTASLRINPGQQEVCFTLTVSNIAPATAAHIHIGTTTQAGPVVVGLAAPITGSSSGCVSLNQDTAIDIIHNPQNYYVNVHNAEFPAGAIRGQLG